MVIHDLYLKSISIPPHETHTILIVYPNAVLPRPVSAKRLQMISRWYFQVIERHRGIQDSEFLEGPSLQISRQVTALARLP